MDGREIAGAVCLVISIALVGLHAYTTLRPRTPSPGTEGVGAVIEKLADKAPHLAGALTFMVIGLIVLGYLDVSFVAESTD